MNKRTRQMFQNESSRSILALCHIPLGADFHTLLSKQVDQLLEYADAHNYRQPKNAKGSRARYFHARLQRMAQRATLD